MHSIHDTSHTISLGVKKFISGTFLSRITGFGREIAMACIFGATAQIAAFWVAYRLVHLCRYMLGEGAMNVAFIPHFEALRHRDELQSARFFYQLSVLLGAVCLLLIGIFACLGGTLLKCNIVPASYKEIIVLSIYLLPTIFFICLYALNSAFLNCQQIFFLPSIAPAVTNVLWIGLIIFFYRFTNHDGIKNLALFLGYIFSCQWLVTLPSVIRFLREKLGKQFWKTGFSPFLHKELRALLRLFAFSIFTLSLLQINGFVDSFFGRVAALEGPAFLWYALRLQQVPIAFLGVGFFKILLPAIGRAFVTQDRCQIQKLTAFSLQRIFLLLIPLVGAMLPLSLSTVQCMFGYGAFTSTAIHETTLCLLGYGIGIIPAVVMYIVIAIMYANRKFFLVNICFCQGVISNFLLNALFIYVFHLGVFGIAVATSIASTCSTLIFGIIIFKGFEIWNKKMTRLLLKLSISTVIASVSTLYGLSIFFGDPTLSWLFYKNNTLSNHPLLMVLWGSLLYLLIFLGLVILLKIRQYKEFVPQRFQRVHA